MRRRAGGAPRCALGRLGRLLGGHRCALLLFLLVALLRILGGLRLDLLLRLPPLLLPLLLLLLAYGLFLHVGKPRELLGAVPAVRVEFAAACAGGRTHHVDHRVDSERLLLFLLPLRELLHLSLKRRERIQVGRHGRHLVLGLERHMHAPLHGLSTFARPPLHFACRRDGGRHWRLSRALRRYLEDLYECYGIPRADLSAYRKKVCRAMRCARRTKRRPRRDATHAARRAHIR